MKSVKEATLSGAKWGMIEKLSVQGIRFILSLIMARLLSPGDYGQISMIVVFIVFSDVLVDCGFNNALIRKKERTQDDYSTVFYFNTAIAIVCYGLLFFIAPFVAEFFKMPILKALLRVQALSVILNALFAVQLAKLTAELNFRAIAKCNFISSLFSGCIGIIFAYIGFGVWALVFQALFDCIIKVIAFSIICKWKPSPRFSKESFKCMFSYGSKLLISNLINKIYQSLTTLIIGKFYSAGDLGKYDRGASLASFPPDNINAVMQKVTFPILAKLQDNQDKLIGVYKKYIRMLSIVIFFSSLLLAALAKPLILIILGSKWAGAIIFLQIYTFAVCFMHIDTVNLNLLFVRGRSDLVLKLEGIKKTLSTLVLIASIPFGVVAICVAKVIHTQITIICDSYYTGKFFGYGLIRQIRDVGPYFIFSIFACLPAFLLSFTNLNNFVVIAFGLLCAFVIYYLLLRRDEIFIEMFSIIRSSLKKQ